MHLRSVPSGKRKEGGSRLIFGGRAAEDGNGNRTANLSHFALLTQVAADKLPTTLQ